MYLTNSFIYLDVFPFKMHTAQKENSMLHNHATCNWLSLPIYIYSSSTCSTTAEGSRDGLTRARFCNYSYMCSWWWVELPAETCRESSLQKYNKLYIVASCWWTIIDSCWYIYIYIYIYTVYIYIYTHTHMPYFAVEWASILRRHWFWDRNSDILTSNLHDLCQSLHANASCWPKCILDLPSMSRTSHHSLIILSSSAILPQRVKCLYKTRNNKVIFKTNISNFVEHLISWYHSRKFSRNYV